MQPISTLRSLRLFAIILVAASIISCESKDSKKTEVKATQVTTDTLPPLDKDSGSTTRPETIKN